jgi:protein-disulfide isomerase
LKEEDQKAVEALEKAGLLCTIIDLGLASSTARMKAKIEGVNATPTLIYKGQKLKGLQQIMGLLEMPTDI